MLIHGFGEDGEIWERQVKFLKDHFLLIIPDLPGSGKSGVISQESGVGMEEYAEVIKSILSEENISSCVMIGHSMGGYITLAFAEKYPGMLSSFGLVHSSAFADSEEKKEARRKSIAFIKSNGSYEFLKTAIPGLFMDQDESKSPDPYIQELVEKGRSFTPGALVQYYEAMIARPDRTAVLKSFNGPIIFIMGQHDKAVPFQHSLQQCYMPLRSHIHILRNSAHMGMIEETDKTNNFLLDFLR
jgi:pimeloyl-ACP methyl ester carboxylesterase